MRTALPFAFAFALLAGLAACKSATPLSIDITAGLEKDAFSADPPVTQVDIAVTSLDGSVNLQVSAEPGGTFDFGNLKDDQQVTLEVTGMDATGATVLRGRSLAGISLGGITGGIPVFVQRVGQWARPPEGLLQTHIGGVGTTLGDRYLLVTGGEKAAGDVATADPKRVDAYDILSLAGAVSTAFPRTPASAVSLGDAVLLIDAVGATWVDYAAGSTYDATAPDDFVFADVAGGITVPASDGRFFVVGGARRGEATKAVLAVAADGSLTAHATVTARAGAAAVWIDTVGLVIAGGSADGAGVEVLKDDADAFATRGYPADPVEGAGAVTDGGKGIALIGGTLGGAAAPTRIVDPGCLGEDCAAKDVAKATLPAAFGKVTAYALEGTRILVVADESGGMMLTRSFLVDLTGGADGWTELPLKEPRRGAIPMPSALGSLAIFGGEHVDGTPATSVEMFFTK